MLPGTRERFSVACFLLIDPHSSSSASEGSGWLAAPGGGTRGAPRRELDRLLQERVGASFEMTS